MVVTGVHVDGISRRIVIFVFQRHTSTDQHVSAVALQIRIARCAAIHVPCRGPRLDFRCCHRRLRHREPEGEDEDEIECLFHWNIIVLLVVDNR